MILYNITCKVDNEVQEEWRRWMLDDHIPKVLQTGYFIKYKLCRLVSHKEPDETTYAIQYFASDMASLHRYTVQHAPRLQLEHQAKFGQRVVAFRTMLEVEQEGVGTTEN